MSHGAVSEAFMEGDAGRVGIGDACAEIAYILLLQTGFQRGIQ